MKNWTIKKRIVTGFASVLVLFIAVSTVSNLLLSKIKTHQDALTEDALPGLEVSEAIVATAGEIQLNALRHLLAKTPAEKAQFDNSIASLIETNRQELTNYESSIFRQADRDQFAKVKVTHDDYIKALGPLLELSRAGKMDEASELNKQSLRPCFVAYRNECEALFDENKVCGDTAAAESQKAVLLAKQLVFGLSAAAIILGISLSIIIITGLNRALSLVAGMLKDGSSQVASAAGQVSSASQTLAEGASEQAASIEESSASLEELSSMTKRNAENAQKANELAREARTVAERGSGDVQTMSSAMQAIKSSSDDIAKIIKTIDEIAFQTNILALNAAVEAARAGEAGMGFAVVADEVRNLAQRSAHAAKETAVKIEGAIRNTAEGVQISSKVADLLNEIVAKVRQVDELVAEVSGASREQTQGITQINAAVGQMDKVTQSNASSAEESAAAAEELNAQAAAMKQTVGDLQKLVSGTGVVNEEETRHQKLPVPALKPADNIRANGKRHISKPIAAQRLEPVAPVARRDEIPLESDFKNF